MVWLTDMGPWVGEGQGAWEYCSLLFPHMKGPMDSNTQPALVLNSLTKRNIHFHSFLNHIFFSEYGVHKVYNLNFFHWQAFFPIFLEQILSILCCVFIYEFLAQKIFNHRLLEVDRKLNSIPTNIPSNITLISWETSLTWNLIIFSLLKWHWAQVVVCFWANKKTF